MRQVNLYDAKTSLSELVTRAMGGEEVVIAKHGKPMVKLVPVGNRARVAGSAKGTVKMAADFAATPDEMKDYL